MKIFDYFSTEEKSWIEKIRVCDWKAAKFLADMIEQGNFHKTLGNGSLFIMSDNDNLVSFCTLTQRDCIKDDDLFPWIGFVYTADDYRGNRYSGKLIDEACKRASQQGFDKVYLATDHIGLYEKYGFEYTQSRIDIYGDMSRIYVSKLEKGEFMRNDITIRPETPKDYKDIISLILRSFSEGTDYSDGSDIIALIEEMRMSENYIPELSFVAELDGKIVGHFLFSKFPLSETKDGGHINDGSIAMLAPVSVHADHFHKHIGITMLTLGIEQVKKHGFKGITVEGDYHFYNRVGFKTSSEYGIYPTSGFPMNEPRCMMCMETYTGSLENINGYIVYDMYYNA